MATRVFAEAVYRRRSKADAIFRYLHFADINLDAEPDGADWPTLHFRLKEAAYTFYPICRRIIGFHDMRLSVNAEARSFVGNFQASQCTTDLRLQDAVS